MLQPPCTHSPNEVTNDCIIANRERQQNENTNLILISDEICLADNDQDDDDLIYLETTYLDTTNNSKQTNTSVVNRNYNINLPLQKSPQMLYEYYHKKTAKNCSYE